MVGQTNKEPAEENDSQRRTRQTKNYPVVAFEEALCIPQGINANSLDGEILRLTLLQQLSLPPTTQATRDLITGSGKYGLTTGGYSASKLEITEAGKLILATEKPTKEIKLKEFELAIGRIAPFSELYQKLKEKRLVSETILSDELVKVGVQKKDSLVVTRVFIQNIRYLGLIEKIEDKEHVRAIDYVIDQSSSSVDKGTDSDQEPQAIPHVPEQPARDMVQPEIGKRPSLHINVEIHIAPDASLAQIDQIFDSMAKHLYQQ